MNNDTIRLLGTSTSPDNHIVEPNLWKGREMPGESGIPLLDGVAFHLIKPYDFAEDGYRFLHGVAVAWHKGRLFASFGHNCGPENTATEEARGRVSDDGGNTWGDIFTIASAPELGIAVSHGVFCSHHGELWAFHGAYRGTMEQVHTRAYILDEVTGQWRERGVIVEDGFWPLQEPVRVADGNWIMAGIAVRGDCPAGGIHPPAVAISHGDNFARWDLIVIPCNASGTVWGESTVFVDGRRVVNVARYGEEPRALMAVSEDCGRSWSLSKPSNLTMTTSKPYCGTLSDGRHYLIGTTIADCGMRRAPLTIALSRPGESLFSSVFAIRHAECMGWAVESHPSASLSYPYAVEHEGKLYVGYSNNGGNVGRVGEGRELWNNNSAELAVIPIQALDISEPTEILKHTRKVTL